MKKQYVQPAMEVETIATELPISTSNSINMKIDSNPANSIDDGEFLSKGRNVFDFND